MAFGKKKPYEPESTELQQDQSNIALEQIEFVTPATSNPKVYELAAGAVLVAAAFFGTLYFLGADGAQPQVPAFTAGIGETAPRARSYERDPNFPKSYNDGTQVTFTMVQTATGFDAIDSELHERCLKSIDAGSARQAEATGQVVMTTDKGAEFLACTMTVYKSRFCQPFYRERLVSRLDEFVRAIRKQASLEKQAKAAINAELNQYGMQLADEHNSDYRPPPKSRVSTRLAGGLYDLSKQGLLAPGDFGFLSGAPAELRDLMAEPSQQICG